MEPNVSKSQAACRAILEQRLGVHVGRVLRRLGQDKPRYVRLEVLPEDRARVLAAYDRRCVYCTAERGTHLGIDFLVPPSREGTAHPENLVASCDACRSARKGKHLDAFIESRLDLDAHAVYERIARATAILRAGAIVVRRAA
jgi:hypothetical protein